MGTRKCALSETNNRNVNNPPETADVQNGDGVKN